MKKVLHITTHMGGGVGKVLSGIASELQSEWKHSILLLEKPEKKNFVDQCLNNDVEIIVAASDKMIRQELQKADVVEIEWWHHPVMARFLSDFPDVPSRLVIWSHISGTYYPYIPYELIKIPNQFLFTSPYSLENIYWSDQEREWIKLNTEIVYSSGGFEKIKVKRKLHKEFNIGYIGTQSYAKLHPEFLSYCEAVSKIEAVSFTLVGDKTNQAALLTVAKDKGIDKKFHFVDYVDNVSEEFSNMDVFGYILNPDHFGTTENVLLEAMAASLPVVCLNQCTEKYLVDNGKTGLLVSNIEEYKNAIYFLYNNPVERIRLGENARRMVLDKFAVKNTVKALHRIYDLNMEKEKVLYDFSGFLGKDPYEYFLACLPPDLKKKLKNEVKLDGKKVKLPPILLEKNKSSIQHFAKVYPDNIYLQYLKKIYKLF